jgi:hypothetical protein
MPQRVSVCPITNINYVLAAAVYSAFCCRIAGPPRTCGLWTSGRPAGRDAGCDIVELGMDLPSYHDLTHDEDMGVAGWCGERTQDDG